MGINDTVKLVNGPVWHNLANKDSYKKLNILINYFYSNIFFFETFTAFCATTTIFIRSVLWRDPILEDDINNVHNLQSYQEDHLFTI